MTRESHQIVGVWSSILTFTLLRGKHLPEATALLSAAALYVGNMWPDVDVKWAGVYNGKRGIFAHRGITHSLALALSALVGSSVLYRFEGVEVLPLMFFSLGWLIHLVADAFSPTGIPLHITYYPRFRLPTVYRTRTGSEAGALLLMLLLVFLGFLPFLPREVLITIKEAVSSLLHALVGGGKIALEYLHRLA